MGRRILILTLCAAILTASGCRSRAEKNRPETTPAPVYTAAPTPEPTASPTPSPTPVPTPDPTPVPAWIKLEAAENYTLFTGASEGAKALRTFLTEECADEVSAYVPEHLTEPMFTLLFTPAGSGDISQAAEDARLIRMATDERMIESGLLEELLPAFESRYGYRVEVYTGDPDAAQSWAGAGAADLTLITESIAYGMSRQGFIAITAFTSTQYAIP
jgi:hypothetical protein